MFKLARLLTLLALFGAMPAAAQEDPAVSWATVTQEIVPSLEGRALSARARAEQAGQYFEGALPLEAAFPRLVGAPLNSRAWLEAQLARLDAEAAGRVAERTAPQPELPQWQLQYLKAAQLKALDAEDAATQLERRLYLGLRNLLERSPGLERSALAPTLLELDAALAAADKALAELPEGPEREAAAAEVRAAATAAAEERQRLEALVTALRAHTTAGAPAPDPAADLALLSEGGDAGRWASLRLTLLRPFLTSEGRDRVDAAELAKLEAALPARRAALEAAQAQLAALNAEPPPVVEGGEAAMTAALEAARAALAAVEAAPAVDTDGSALAGVREEAVELDRARAAAAVAIAERRVVLAAAAREATTASAERSRTLAEETRREADVAQTQATSASQRVQAELLTALASEQEAATAAWSSLEVAQAARKQTLTDLQDALLQADSDAEAALRKGALDVSRQTEVDRVYHDLRGQISQLRKEVSSANAALLDARRALGRTQSDGESARADFVRKVNALGAAADPELVLRWDTAQAELKRARAEAVSEIENHRDERLHLLRDTRDLRRHLRAEISRETAQEDQRYLLEDVQQEFRLLGPYLATLGQDRLEWGLALPAHLLDFRWIRGVILGSLWLIVVGIVWFWSRRKVGALVERLLTALTERAPLWQRRDLSGLQEPCATSLRALIDVGLGYALAGPLGDSFPELGLLLLIYLQFATFRLAMGLFDLAISKHPATRPAWKVLAPDHWTLARRTVRLTLLWFIARQFTSYLAREVMGTDVLHDVIMTGFTVAFVVLAAGLLHLWEPHLRPSLGRASMPESLRFLKAAPSTPLSRAPRALLAAGVIVISDAWNLLNMRTSERSHINRLLNWINRRQLAGDDQTPAWSPPDELRSTLLTDDCEESWYVDRPELDAAFKEAFEVWKTQSRRGRLVVVGDRGQGKHIWLTRLCAALTAEGRTVTRVSMDRRLITAADALGWLAELAGLEETPTTSEAMEEALLALEPRVWVIDGLERAFLRKVRGFDALETLMSVLQQASTRHFWVLSVHRPAWRYLTRLRALFDTQVFPTVLELSPMGEADLRKLVRARTDAAGWTVTFRSDAPGGTPEEIALERERAERRFFRLLGEASEGNTAVALTMWADCMVPGEEPQEVGARFRENPAARLPASLDDADLFVLSAARIQERLNEPELVEVTRLPPGIVRASLRSLVEVGVLEAHDHHFTIPVSHLPGVTRLLRRRHLVP